MEGNFEHEVCFRLGAVEKRLKVASLPHAGMTYPLNGSGLKALIKAVHPVKGSLGFVAHLAPVQEVDHEYLLQHGWTLAN